jgi:hypothetical protein
MVTVSPLTEQAEFDVMIGVMGALEVATTVKVEPYPAEVGAPVKLTVCVASVALVDSLIEEAAE